MRRISLNVRGRNSRSAWQGVALLFVVLGAALAIWLTVLPRFAKPAQPLSSPAERMATELAHLKMLGHALELDAAEHDGKFPPTIADIHWRQNLPGMDWNGLPAAVSRFHHPDGARISEWTYYPGKTEADPPETILAASPVAVGPHRDQRLVVYVNGVAEAIPEMHKETLNTGRPGRPSPERMFTMIKRLPTLPGTLPDQLRQVLAVAAFETIRADRAGRVVEPLAQGRVVALAWRNPPRAGSSG